MDLPRKLQQEHRDGLPRKQEHREGLPRNFEQEHREGLRENSRNIVMHCENSCKIRRREPGASIPSTGHTSIVMDCLENYKDIE